MSQDPVLGFDFSNTSDVELPPMAGVRELIFDKAPVIQMINRGGEQVKAVVAMPKINDGGKGTFPAEEQNRMVYLCFNLSDSRQATQAKQMFLAAGIAVTDFASAAQQIVGKIARGEFKQTNSVKDGSPVVYFNLVKWIVDVSMLTNVPGRTPPVPQVQA